MRSLLKKLFVLIAPALILLSQTVSAMAEIMPLDEIKSGMSGTGYAVVDNSGIIKPFNVDIVGLTNSGKGSMRMIMARASGDLMNETGGVLQGMSGSPIYIDGKLIGALAIGIQNTSPYTFFITPIEDMVKIWELPDTKDADLVFNPGKKENTKPAETVTENKDAGEEKISSDGEEKNAVFFSGFDSNGLDFLKRELQPLGFKNFYAVPNSSSGRINYGASLQPGSPMGVAVVCGDFTVGGTGTVTAIDDNKIVAFGHAFSHAGNVNFFMTDSNVLGPIKGTTSGGIRMANIGSIIGRINQDREAGIAGVVGKIPMSVPITVNVKNIPRDTVDTYRAMIAYNENLMPKLSATIAYAALSKTADSLVNSTVAVDFSIKTNAVESGTFSRRNMFYNDADVGQVAIIELMQAMNLICNNTTQESGVFNIEVNMALDTQRNTATLISAVPDKKIVKAGDTVNFTVKIQPYRKPVETLVVPYTIPLSTPEGALTLDIHGGAFVQTAQTLPQGVILPSTEPPDKLFEKNIRNFINAGRSNQIVIEPSAAAKKVQLPPKKPATNQKRSIKFGKKTSASPNQRFETSYIIDNLIQTAIKISK